MQVLARKNSIHLVKYSNGFYGVERITKGCGCGLKYGSKDECIDFFNETIKTVRKSKNDFNLEVYGRAV